MPHSQQVKDAQVLTCLGHDRLIRGDDQHRHVDGRRAREHVTDKPLVPGDIDEVEPHVAKVQVRKAQVDRDASLFFFRQAISVDASECRDQSCLAVVDVPRGAEYQVPFHGCHLAHLRAMAEPISQSATSTTVSPIINSITSYRSRARASLTQ